MAEGVMTVDGKPVELDAAKVEQDFARAMSAPPAADVPAPPRRAESDSAAPKPKRGRPPKSDKARVSAAPVAAPKASSADLDNQRSDGVKGLVQTAAGLALVADMRTPDENIAWRADAVTLANAAEPLASACVEVARSNAAFAAVLDKVTKAGPYSALIAVGVQVGAQLAYNHGMPIGKVFGAKEPAELVAELASDSPAVS